MQFYLALWVKFHFIRSTHINLTIKFFAYSQTAREIFCTSNDLMCLRIDRPSAMIVYFYYLNKLPDLIETFFFVMKKSWRQISFLHIYHHIVIIVVIYADIYYQPG